MKTLFVRFVKNESGATAIEYGLIAALMSVGIIAGINILSGVFFFKQKTAYEI